MSRILIIEDEPALQRALAANFTFDSHEVLTASDGRTGYQMAVDNQPDVVILDLMLPGMSGFEVCRKLRAEGVTTPVLMLTARGEEADRITGLDLGADDYVTKPFSVRELSARVRALLRRANPPHALPDRLRIDDIEIDFRSYEARKSGQPLDLTRKEFHLVQLLVARTGEAVSREEILNKVWGMEVYVTTRTVDTHVANLRSKMERDPRHPEHLITVHGIGYRWAGGTS
ncbi:MAG: response regulator transcription factor [Acidobacteria bacterium]|nr:response regulator transcription factor [Acidobacteriota bacterium]